jgi:uncharacterized protein (DUF488 family)
MKVYTIGHSNRSYADFNKILKTYNINLVIDVRKIPKSTRFPHFTKENLETQLPKNKIDYIHLQELGGYKKEGYQTFSQTKEYFDAINKLIAIIANKTASIFCSEILWWRCHRRYIAKTLVEKRIQVTHIIDLNQTQEHKPEEKEIKEKMKTKIFCDKKAKKNSP